MEIVTPPATAVHTCGAAGADDVAKILGFAVQPADEAMGASGICFYAARAVSDEGSASYAVVTAAGLEQRRAYFGALARRCAGAALLPRAPACASYAKLAAAMDLDAYFNARTGDESATPIALFGNAAFATPEGVFVRRGPCVVEAVVVLGQTVDLARSVKLASLVAAGLAHEAER